MQLDHYAPGKHLLIDLYGATNLTDSNKIEQALLKAALECEAHVLNIKLHSFGTNQGVTGVLLLAESHISIHTWPENEFAAIDIFMCGDCKPEKALPILKNAFQPAELEIREYERGVRIGQPLLSSTDNSSDVIER